MHSQDWRPKPAVEAMANLSKLMGGILSDMVSGDQHELSDTLARDCNQDQQALAKRMDPHPAQE
ncbi:hypothetical protein BRADI_3g08882v3 [Brachypodium distachyon]|uniref:Uncharacterized protein n=1 Tax=Brachypodium distachyon TaxID=15368 RepID=A0A2K2CW40_BRADI|nr:hypothetical protein BRADI_3g08882v3 [Brachypodium distachyon]